MMSFSTVVPASFTKAAATSGPPPIKRSGYLQREPAQRPQLRHERADFGRLTLIVGVGAAHQFAQQRQRRQEPLRPGALIGKFGGDLPPARADLAQDHVVADPDVVEDDLIEVMLAVQQPDRCDCHSRRGQIDDELAQARVPVFVLQRAVRHNAIM